jgi:8-oxo-dGTP pyrophosphatase MutT (NUDIX family)
VDLSGLNLRAAVRALVVDADDRVLLVRFEFSRGTVWALPGGGIEPGEEQHEALHRELAEEIGMTDAEIGPCVWERTWVGRMGTWDGQRDQAFLVRCEEHEPEPHFDWDQLRAEGVHELRWWTVDELLAVPGDRDRISPFAPFELPELVAEVVRNGPPAEPFIVLNVYESIVPPPVSPEVP